MSARVQNRDSTGTRLHVVTGKGGTGKTTTAAALALALASEGGDVLLVEVEGRQGIAELFDCAALPYEERWIAGSGRSGGSVYALAVDAEEALLEYLDMFYGIRRAGQALTRFGVVDFATTIAPGVRDVLLTGKATEAARRRANSDHRPRHSTRRGPKSGAEDGFVYDAVVLDGPPTGRIAQFLNVNAEVAGLAKVGPIRNHADRVMGVIRSPETAVHFVTTLEEMPVQECLDGIGHVRQVGIAVGNVLINMAREPLLSTDHQRLAADGQVDANVLAQGLRAAGIPAPEHTARELSLEVTAHARRLRVESAMRDRLAELRLPTRELPLIPDGVDMDALRYMASRLKEQGAG